MDRWKWTGGFGRQRLPAWPCPRCNTGSLSLKKDSMVIVTSGATKSCEQAVDYDPFSDYEARFTCVAGCSRPGCREHCVVTGAVYYEPVIDEEGGGQTSDYLVPVCIHPPPHIISIPRRCPKDVRGELESAFGLFWADSRSAANRIRASVELLLTRLGTKRFSVGKGRRHRLNLHDRIELFRKDNPELGPARATDAALLC